MVFYRLLDKYMEQYIEKQMKQFDKLIKNQVALEWIKAVLEVTWLKGNKEGYEEAGKHLGFNK